MGENLRAEPKHEHKLLHPDIFKREGEKRSGTSRALLSTLAALGITATVAMNDAEAQTANIESGASWSDGLTQLHQLAQNDKRDTEARAVMRRDGRTIMLGMPRNYNERKVFEDVQREAAVVCEITVHTLASEKNGLPQGAAAANIELPPAPLEAGTPVVVRSMIDGNKKPGETKLGPFKVNATMSPNGVMHYYKEINYSPDVVKDVGYLMSAIFGRWWDPKSRSDIQDVMTRMKVPDITFMLYVNQGWRTHIDQRLAGMTDAQLKAVTDKLGAEDAASLGRNPESVTGPELRKVQETAVLEALVSNDQEFAKIFFAGDDVGLQKQQGWVQLVRTPNKQSLHAAFAEYNNYIQHSMQGPVTLEDQQRLAEAYRNIGLELVRDEHPDRTPCGISEAQGR